MQYRTAAKERTRRTFNLQIALVLHSIRHNLFAYCTWLCSGKRSWSKATGKTLLKCNSYKLLAAIESRDTHDGEGASYEYVLSSTNISTATWEITQEARPSTSPCIWNQLYQQLIINSPIWIYMARPSNVVADGPVPHTLVQCSSMSNDNNSNNLLECAFADYPPMTR